MDIETYNKIKEKLDECETQVDCERYCGDEQISRCDKVRTHINNLDTVTLNISLNKNNPDTPSAKAYIIKNYPMMYDSEIFQGNPDDCLSVMVCPDCGHVSRVCIDAHDDFICDCGEFLDISRDVAVD